MNRKPFVTRVHNGEKARVFPGIQHLGRHNAHLLGEGEGYILILVSNEDVYDSFVVDVRVPYAECIAQYYQFIGMQGPASFSPPDFVRLKHDQ